MAVIPLTYFGKQHRVEMSKLSEEEEEYFRLYGELPPKPLTTRVKTAVQSTVGCVRRVATNPATIFESAAAVAKRKAQDIENQAFNYGPPYHDVSTHGMVVVAIVT